MSCSSLTSDLKAYAVGELTRREQSAVEDHVRECQHCREELERLNLTRSALASIEDEEVPRRIAFVSDQVFEPRWWRTIWHSGPAMGLASAGVLAAAILMHGFARPLPPVGQAGIAAVQSEEVSNIERRVESQVSARVDAAVAKAVNEAQARQTAEFAKVLNATTIRFELQRGRDLAIVQQGAEYYEKQMGRFVVASNAPNPADNPGPAQ